MIHCAIKLYIGYEHLFLLQEMAENAPTVFNVHVHDFGDAVWVALRDPSVVVRERAVEALRACLCVIEKRETRWRVQWYVAFVSGLLLVNHD